MSDLERERLEFEAWVVRDQNLAIGREGYGRYRNYGTGVAWEAWQARAAREDALVTLLRKLPLDSFGDDMGEHDAADFVDHAGEFFEVMQAAKKLLGDKR